MQLHPNVKDGFCKLDKSCIAREILAYLFEHPNAQDTFEGIAEWWLLKRKIILNKIVVKEAIDDLVKQGWLKEEKSQGNSPRYRINRVKRK